MSVVVSPHDQRMQQMINALQALQNSGATDTTTQQVVAVLIPLIRELQAIRMTLVSLPLPTNIKNLDL